MPPSFPSVRENDGGLRPRLVENVAGGATRLGAHGALDGPKDLEHVLTSVGGWQDPHRTDDHARPLLLEPCQRGVHSTRCELTH